MADIKCWCVYDVLNGCSIGVRAMRRPPVVVTSPHEGAFDINHINIIDCHIFKMTGGRFHLKKGTVCNGKVVTIIPHFPVKGINGLRPSPLLKAREKQKSE